MTVYEVIEDDYDHSVFIIVSSPNDKIEFHSPVGAEIRQWIKDHEGTYYVRTGAPWADIKTEAPQ